MRNPYYFNFTWLAIIVAVLSALLLSMKECHYIFDFESRVENILIGILSSAFLLLGIEIINFIVDRKKYGGLHGVYKRTIITDVLPEGKRAEDFNAEAKALLLIGGKKVINDSRYAEIMGYHEIGNEWRIELKYLYHGIYEGIADYHKYWDGYGNPAKVKFTLTLNQSDRRSGMGSYKYVERFDYGTYNCYISDVDKIEIVVYYKNTVPSGLAEGYEVWEKTD